MYCTRLKYTYVFVSIWRRLLNPVFFSLDYYENDEFTSENRNKQIQLKLRTELN